jgi:hypothetical protein
MELLVSRSRVVVLQATESAKWGRRKKNPESMEESGSEPVRWIDVASRAQGSFSARVHFRVSWPELPFVEVALIVSRNLTGVLT